MNEPVNSPPSTGNTKRPTLIDVAQLAGVSHMTVSRYLRGRGTPRAGTRERIDAAIEELRYRPNLAARSMRTRRDGLVAILVPATDNAYSPAHVLSASTATAHQHGYEVEVVMVEGGPMNRTQRALELSDSGLVEGILSLAPLSDGDLDGIHPDNAPIISYEVYDDQLRGAGILLDASPIAQFVDHLAGLGHRRFIHLAGPQGHPAAEARELAYLTAIERCGVESFAVLGRSWDGAAAVRAIRDLPDDCGVTAAVCVNDDLAGGAIRGALDRGWSVPDTLSITGWGNYRLGEYLPPGLTTVDVDHALLGRHAMEALVAILQGEDPPNEGELARLNTLVWRGSAGTPPA